ncbi:MAG: SH3 domain-containing protein [Verrucomicrobia bacterium]|nr:SH3 domain-containing protein [Deltaproteobacteria bacterium]
MKVSPVFLLIMLLAVTTVAAAPSAPQKMRPYAGIGVLLLPINNNDPGDPLPLYEEPALARQGELDRTKIPTFDWIFGASAVAQPLIVMARKGTWLRVAYDDAGREAWLNPPRQIAFQGWDLFLKGNVSRLLPGLQKKYYQLFQLPGSSPVAALTLKQPFKVLRLENDWAMVLIEQNSLGWLRWRDGDGRLLIGIVTKPVVRQP